MLGNFDIAGLFGISRDTASGILTKSNNIDQDKYDSRMFTDLMEASQELQSLKGRGPEQIGEALLKDIWSSYYKAAPELTEKETVEKPFQVNRPYVERLLADKDTAAARIYTQLDELSAAMATVEAGKGMLEEIEKSQELKKAMEYADKAAEAAQEGDEEEMQANIDAAQEAMQEAALTLRRATKQAAEAGKEKAEEVQRVLGGWGVGTEELKSIPIKERIEFINSMIKSPTLKKMSELAGRFRNLARARQKSKVQHQRDEVHSIEMGNDVAHLLPAEFALLRHKTLKLEFYRKYTERQLLQYELNAKEKQGRGPIVCMVDRSGSMQGDRMTWAVAVTLALADTAARQKRRMKVIFFDTQIVRTVEIEPGEKDIQKIMQIATVTAGGGTKYEPALEEGIRTIKEAAYKKADMVFITDGVCKTEERLLEEMRAAKEQQSFKVLSVLIGSDPGKELNKFSDKVWAVKEFNSDTAGDIFEEVY